MMPSTDTAAATTRAPGPIPPPLGLYVHLPWCVRKCPYCDFNSHAVRGGVPVDDYLDALFRDADGEQQIAGARPVETVFIGGGTPSLFPPEAIARLLDGLRPTLNIRDDAEITLEANPGTVETERFAGFREAGVNRLSIGVQSFHAVHLRRLGRIHGPDEAVAAAKSARAAGFERFNLDLMYALPGQSVAEAVADVDRAIDLGARHVSHYQLTLEPGTAFHARPPALPDDDTAAEMQDACAERLENAGLARYEISGWAAPGETCRHNLNYWTFGDYLALGAGAHGKVTLPEGIHRYSKVRLPRLFMAAAGTEKATDSWQRVPVNELPLEFMMNALRLTAGVPRRYAVERTGLPWSSFAAAVADAVARGWLEPSEDRLRPTARGLDFLNDLLAGFMPAS
ncbi:MAG TPA: radical SAM family heme chaperone HemW [Gammaproteobacteria bacterium]|nr:radical SAM family heme chaperone HemW [Gammaproteobacteria bacterium]